VGCAITRPRLHSAIRLPPRLGRSATSTASGVARYNSSRPATYEGSVNAQSVLVLRAPFGARIDAQIDGRGTVTGRLTSGCSYQMVWQKEGK
jgi:hypothetical protein